MIDIRPFNRRSLAKFVIDYKPQIHRDVVDCLQSIVCIATPLGGGKIHVEVIGAQHWRVREALHDQHGLTCVSFPVLVLPIDNYATADAAPQVIG